MRILAICFTLLIYSCAPSKYAGPAHVTCNAPQLKSTITDDTIGEIYYKELNEIDYIRATPKTKVVIFGPNLSCIVERPQ